MAASPKKDVPSLAMPDGRSILSMCARTLCPPVAVNKPAVTMPGASIGYRNILAGEK